MQWREPTWPETWEQQSLTCTEGCASLTRMAEGLMRQYRDTGVPSPIPPADVRGPRLLQQRPERGQLVVAPVAHFASGVATESQELEPSHLDEAAVSLHVGGGPRRWAPAEQGQTVRAGGEARRGDPEDFQRGVEAPRWPQGTSLCELKLTTSRLWLAFDISIKMRRTLVTPMRRVYVKAAVFTLSRRHCGTIQSLPELLLYAASQGQSVRTDRTVVVPGLTFDPNRPQHVIKHLMVQLLVRLHCAVVDHQGGHLPALDQWMFWKLGAALVCLDLKRFIPGKSKCLSARDEMYSNECKDYPDFLSIVSSWPVSCGTTASAKYLWAFVVNGLLRWNEGRAAAAGGALRDAAEGHIGSLHSYSGHLKHVLNQQSQRVLGLQMVQDLTKPAAYTGDEVQSRDAQPGYQRIWKLACAPVDARSLQGLSDKRGDRLITLWQSLPERDKQRVVCPPRRRERQVSGGGLLPNLPLLSIAPLNDMTHFCKALNGFSSHNGRQIAKDTRV